MPPGLDNLKHIVVVMMSGRSFDHMLGALKARDPRIDGLTGNESNADATGKIVRVQPLAAYQGQLDPVPATAFKDVNAQIHGSSDAAMQGFIKNYFDKRRDVDNARAVMNYFTPDKLPVLTSLAMEFAVFNRWFSSVPGPAASNQLFAHYGTSLGSISGTAPVSMPNKPSLFERLADGGATAKLYYFDQASGTMMRPLLNHRPALMGTYDQFLADCQSGALPNYAFVEPNHTDHATDHGVVVASDQHPDHHVLEGENFIATTYNSIRQNAVLWRSTALLIVYDQHGGLYDHVAPPLSVSDGYTADLSVTGTGAPFAFDRLGVRVPAILVSPWIPRGTVVDGRLFDHASIPATVTGLFKNDFVGQGSHELSASTFLDLLSSPTLRPDTPEFQVAAKSAVSGRRRAATSSQSATGGVRGVDATAPVLDVPPALSIAGFRSDVASGDDLLGITPEVERLCAVLAAKDVEPPVSIGLFGDWGSGKTFFMRQMERQFERIKAETRKDPQSSVFCGEIVQLWFNAWHYVDHNIWASLASEIFDKLGEAVAFDSSGHEKNAVAYMRAQLSAKSAVAKQELEQAVGNLSAAEQSVHSTEERLEKLEAQAGHLTNDRFLQALLQGALGFAAAQPEVRQSINQVRLDLDQSLGQAAKALNVPQAESTVAIKNELLALKGFSGRLRALALAIRHSPHRQAWLWYLVVVVLAIAVVPQVAAIAQRMDRRLATAIVTAIGFVVPALKLLPQLNSAFDLIEEARARSASAVQKEYEAQLAVLNVARETAVNTATRLRTEADTKREQVAALENGLEQLRANRQLADFIQRRRESSDYKKHLGVIAHAYADFEQLSILLAKVREETSKDKLLPKIERIVLYVDDLDRCPEDKVVDVLQAIHLLLFFPLFVVVVGVDSRWLLHSLRQHSLAFQAMPGAGGDGEFEGAHWASTPLNYLEKIFQIPFAVRPMNVPGYEQLVESLTAPRVVTGVHPAPESSAAPPAPGATDASPKSPVTEQPTAPTGQLPTQTPSSVPPSPVGEAPKVVPFELNPTYLQLQECERQFMKGLHPLIPSPRAVKRFVNVYRLLRTTVTDAEKHEFVTEDKNGAYQAVQLLLAVQTGYPQIAMEIIRDLLNQNPKGSWWTFVEAYREKHAAQPTPRTRTKAANRKEPAPQRTIDADADADERWRDFLSHVEQVRPAMPTASCRDFVKWGPRVARYSFQSARAVQIAGAPALRKPS